MVVFTSKTVDWAGPFLPIVPLALAQEIFSALSDQCYPCESVVRFSNFGDFGGYGNFGNSFLSSTTSSDILPIIIQHTIGRSHSRRAHVSENPAFVFKLNPDSLHRLGAPPAAPRIGKFRLDQGHHKSQLGSFYPNRNTTPISLIGSCTSGAGTIGAP